jgi:phosphoribosylformylglycinamidine (FGAM) synthase-like amidotransferase family enzyme
MSGGRCGGPRAQVASHAQKYFIRLNSLNKKDKRRSSIHDITHPGGPSNGDVTGASARGACLLCSCIAQSVHEVCTGKQLRLQAIVWNAWLGL